LTDNQNEFAKLKKYIMQKNELIEMAKLSLIFLLSPLSISAQPIITSSHFPTDGTVLSTIECWPVSWQEDTIGENVIWDFSDLNPKTEIADTMEFNASEGSIFAERYPESNKFLKWTLGVGTAYVYYNLNDQNLEELGVAFVSDNGSFYLDYLDGESIIQYPAKYQDSWIDSLELMTINNVYKGVIASEVDGYGTLILPNGIFENVIRIHEVWSVPGWNTDSHTYYYYSPDYQYWLLIVGEEYHYQANPIGTTSIKENTVSESIKICPNPVTFGSDFTIYFEANTEADVEIYSIHGQRVFSEKNVQFQGGKYHVNMITLANTDIYVIKVNSGGRLYTSRFVLE
jgi:hypothetical protein